MFFGPKIMIFLSVTILHIYINYLLTKIFRKRIIVKPVQRTGFHLVLNYDDVKLTPSGRSIDHLPICMNG